MHKETRTQLDGVEVEKDQDQTQESEGLSRPFGHIRIDDKETSYVGPDHWAAILEHITQVKDYFDVADDMAESQPGESPGPALLIDPSRSTTKAEILASIPPRAVTDRLLSRYFRSMEIRQYEAFWQDPWSSPTMWIALLLAMLSLATSLCRRSGEALPSQLERAERATDAFRQRTVQCLVLADYTSLVPHTLEAMLVYMHGEYNRSKDAQPGIFLMMGMVVRLALRMGYHRDPSQSPFSPFHAEMRRRVWTLVCHTGMMFSSQNGFPSLIRAEQSDTRLPRNLLDEDIKPHMAELPPSRPSTDPTPVAFMIAKDAIMNVYRGIYEHLAAMAPTPYDTVLALDQQLQDARAAIPPHLRMRSMDQSVFDPPDLIIKRLYLEFGYQKGRCTLHRQYLTESRTADRYAYSRVVCIEAAMRLLEYQSSLHAELQPGGQLSGQCYYVSSFTTHFFLTAAMIVCLEVSRLDEETGEKQRDSLLAALDRSHKLWRANSPQSAEARKLGNALADVLSNFRQRDRQQWTRRAAVSSAAPTSPLLSARPGDAGSPAVENSSSSQSQSYFGNDTASDVFDSNDWAGSAAADTTWERMLQMPVSVDWDAWDKQLELL
ncbi:MAG: hypothetical protein M1832_000354 [Thelocarpon impressellum]|nr:MAG: hypothetical protein M1832_000354 [Thelocarpon impressellum]